MTARLRATSADGGTLLLDSRGRDLLEPSRLFRLELNGSRVEALTDAVAESEEETAVVSGTADGTAVRVRWTATRIAGEAVWEAGLVLTNEGEAPVRVTRMDPVAARLVAERWSTLYFRSAWGDEFRPERGLTDWELHLDSRSGRSSHGTSPWLGLERDGVGLIVSPAWSGNWHIDLAEGRLVTAGISTWQFATELAPGQSVTAPSVVLAVGDDIDGAAVALTRAVGAAWVPRSAASEELPVEWNHWWPYEDVEVNEQVIWDNAAIAADLGIGVSTVDAGWFGDADAASHWQEQRGDWHHTNTVRFPGGLAALGEGIRAAGTKPGIWMEAEAVGSATTLRAEHPEVLALASERFRPDPSYRRQTESLDPDDPSFLGYVCLGSEAGRQHVARSLDAVVREMGAEWLKLDFNIDPDSGCTRTDHGHGVEDGLFRHYEGLYRVLDEFREAHPQVILEACSSGGLRLDLGIARHVHCIFLSDPDYTEHHLQVLWGASLMLPPVAMLHWPWSQWRGDYPPSQLDFSALTRDEFDTILRAALLHRFGVSLRLPELSDEQRESLREHVRMFTETIAPFVRDGVLTRLTGQPLRVGRGERSPAFQLTLDDRRLLAAFRLEGGRTPDRLRFDGLHPDVQYRVTDLATGDSRPLSGAELSGDGVTVDDRGGRVSSWLLLAEPAT
ncbi:alpha-galactosidase [Lysobacter korlensis]|uniref:alpha-galactosidase n=1 Tax=Lysobacter korlensis TaxID=553636 RepID=A0ABV6RS80_9GAMM